MNNVKNILLITLCSAMISCGADSNNANGEKSSENSTAEAAGQSANFDASCLVEKVKVLPELIPDAKMLEITGKTKVGLTQKGGDFSKGFYRYQWDGKTGRKTTLINDMVVDVEDEVSIIITSIKSSAESFKRGYYPVDKSVSNEQNTKLRKEVELALKGESATESMNKNVAKLRELGKSDAEIMKTYTGITDLAAKSGTQKEIVSGAGEAAVWDARTHELMVNADNTTFWITVTLNEDHKKDLAIAKKIAKLALEACD